MKLVVICLIVQTLRCALSIPHKSEPTISECTAKGGECDESKGRPVCGTDNQTYPTRCHLIRAQCSGHQVSLKHRGTCKDVCLASRTYALQHRSNSPYGVKFVPRCREDGTYAPVQCLESVGCWCVNSQGKPLPNTTVQHGKPVCVKKGKSNQRRSSPRNPVRNKRSCSRMDRAVFNRNLLKLFENEHIRVQQNARSGLSIATGIGGGVAEKIVLEWKFASIDGNKNGMLDKNEYRELKRLIKKVVKPKRCGRSFGKSCDVDQDERLSRQEWANCFSKDNLTLLEGKTTLELKGDQDPIFKDSEAESDCLSDRTAALEEQRSGATALYVPECTADGRYQRVQCYRSTGYCWCVHEDTGKNIPGTSTKDKRPQCDVYSSVGGRQMRGCPDDKKLEFLKDLKDFLKQQIASNSVTAADNTKWITEDEKIATLSFVLLDKNKNKVWERKEWKTFRELVTATRQLRKCGKKMPRYCDVNNDRKITLSEWLNCLQTQRTPYVDSAAKISSPSSGSDGGSSDVWKPSLSASSTSKFRGPNPLESVLKSD
ncbi:SPARC-related modular calcium-binding protein 2 isoform X2 [Toxorhynchites rutilus septentrionalis]|uniref:SPARC-related modular calcium-binding protein 2 isoform X2 n=1 Tax=Toxorhynchites rutilus septentrionalis TaxID=329112 RepID=UPI002478D2BA|nr:SPARC-related modular calcium-binding protein 2 isoform X2 [Toxorhynchites rutilus septentrionalis]